MVEDDDGSNGNRQPVTSRDITGVLWRELADHVNSWFDGVTIADLVKRGEEVGLPRAGAGQPMYFI